MREEHKRAILTACSVGLWAGAVTLAAGSWASLATVVLMVGAATVLTITRVLKSTNDTLMSVYRAGTDRTSAEEDDRESRSFSAGIQAGRGWAREENHEAPPGR